MKSSRTPRNARSTTNMALNFCCAEVLPIRPAGPVERPAASRVDLAAPTASQASRARAAVAHDTHSRRRRRALEATLASCPATPKTFSPILPRWAGSMARTISAASFLAGARSAAALVSGRLAAARASGRRMGLGNPRPRRQLSRSRSCLRWKSMWKFLCSRNFEC